VAGSTGESNPFDNEAWRAIALHCMTEPLAASEIARKLGRLQGSINGSIKLMVEAGILVKGPPRKKRTRHSYQLSPQYVPLLKQAQQEAKRGPSSPGQPPALHDGQRLLLIGGSDLPRIAAELRRLSIERDAEWVARVDGPGSRILVAVPDDGPRCDEVEASIRSVRGEAVQARIDRFLDAEAFAQWLDDGT
jgi:DNA-binding MarR family transcriptional regulator